MGTPLLWIGFNLFILAFIALDLGAFNRRLHKVSMREAGFFSMLWVALSILFGLGILHYSGKQAGLEFFTGYLIEKALSVDNLFLFLVIFRTFAVDERFQHRMLEWGILGALVMRGMMILAGAELIQRFSWVLYVFGPFIVYTSNVFAILGLRAMYFLLAGVLSRVRYLTVGLSFVLTFIGAKMIAHKWVDVPEHISLLVVAGILLLALGASLLFPVRSRA